MHGRSGTIYGASSASVVEIGKSLPTNNTNESW
jgi:hypothetical protein